MNKKDTSTAESFAAAHGSLNAFLDRGSAFEGKLTFQGAVRIDGKFTGDVMSDDTLLVGQSGRIIGTATVGEADIGGTIEGTLRVLGTAYFRPTAKLDGELITGKLVVEEGAAINGTVKMSLEDPVEQAKQIQAEVEQTLA